jgi:hypothetical protein
MNATETNRKLWNRKQSEFRRAILSFDRHDRALQMFLSQHAMLHSARISRAGLWSYEDTLLNDITEEQARRIPSNCEHSVVWCIWHIARIEDVTMNILVADGSQIFEAGNWSSKLRITARDTGNAMDMKGVVRLSAAIPIDSLRAYRLAVGRQTRKIVQRLSPETLKQKVDRSRLERVVKERAVTEAASGILEYWGGLTIAGLLLMPPTRHCFIHLNEAMRLKVRSP